MSSKTSSYIGTQQRLKYGTNRDQNKAQLEVYPHLRKY
jgi:hypothetical protein